MKYPNRNQNGTFPSGGPVKRYRMKGARGKLHLAHRLRAELALGKPLPEGAQVHHHNGDLSDDATLVICQDYGYHKLLHARARIVKAGGNPNTERICAYCRQVKPIAAFIKSAASVGAFGKWHCSACPVKIARQAERRAARMMT